MRSEFHASDRHSSSYFDAVPFQEHGSRRRFGGEPRDRTREVWTSVVWQMKALSGKSRQKVSLEKDMDRREAQIETDPDIVNLWASMDPVENKSLEAAHQIGADLCKVRFGGQQFDAFLTPPMYTHLSGHRVAKRRQKRKPFGNLRRVTRFMSQVADTEKIQHSADGKRRVQRGHLTVPWQIETMWVSRFTKATTYVARINWRRYHLPFEVTVASGHKSASDESHEFTNGDMVSYAISQDESGQWHATALALEYSADDCQFDRILLRNVPHTNEQKLLTVVWMIRALTAESKARAGRIPHATERKYIVTLKNEWRAMSPTISQAFEEMYQRRCNLKTMTAAPKKKTKKKKKKVKKKAQRSERRSRSCYPRRSVVDTDSDDFEDTADDSSHSTEESSYDYYYGANDDKKSAVEVVADECEKGKKCEEQSDDSANANHYWLYDVRSDSVLHTERQFYIDFEDMLAFSLFPDFAKWRFFCGYCRLQRVDRFESMVCGLDAHLLLVWLKRPLIQGIFVRPKNREIPLLCKSRAEFDSFEIGQVLSYQIEFDMDKGGALRKRQIVANRPLSALPLVEFSAVNWRSTEESKRSESEALALVRFHKFDKLKKSVSVMRSLLSDLNTVERSGTLLRKKVSFKETQECVRRCERRSDDLLKNDRFELVAWKQWNAEDVFKWLVATLKTRYRIPATAELKVEQRIRIAHFEGHMLAGIGSAHELQWRFGIHSHRREQANFLFDAIRKLTTSSLDDET